jgi:hypothetical protein
VKLTQVLGDFAACRGNRFDLITITQAPTGAGVVTWMREIIMNSE